MTYTERVREQLKSELMSIDRKILFLADEPKELWSTYTVSIPEKVKALEDRRAVILSKLFDNAIDTGGNYDTSGKAHMLP